MSKNILQDIKPLTSSGRRRVADSINYEEEIPKTKEKQPKIVSYKTEDTTPRSKKSILLLVVIVLVVIGLVSSLLYYFGKATVTIKAKSYPIELADMSITAYTDPKENELSFEVMIVPGEESTVVSANDKAKVERQAKGRVTIFNEYSSTPQNLKIDTRLETKDGLIYKTDKAVTVPGAITKNSVTTPGQVEVGIYAEKSGTSYNNESEVDLKIFGFKGTAKYNKFYAKTKGSITGGQSGEMYTVSQADVSSAKNSLEQKLKDKLLENAKVQVPPGYIYFENGLNYEIDSGDNSPIDSVEKDVTITQKGSVAMVLFDEKKLAKYLAKNLLSQFEDGDVNIPELKTFVFSFKNNDNLLLKEAKSISFKLNGSGNVIYKVDENAVINALKNKKRSEFKSIFATFKSIDSAEIKLTPPWRRTFPDNTEDVKLTIN